MKKFILILCGFLLTFSTAGFAHTNFYVPNTTMVNGHPLSSNVTVSASDITTGTLPPAQSPSSIRSGSIPSIAGYSNNLSTAASTIGSTRQQLMVPVPIALTAHVTTPATLELWVPEGGSITLGNYNLRINGPFHGAPGCFVQTGTGIVTFGGTATIRQIQPEWWGVAGDGATDNGPAFQAMWNSLDSSSHNITWQIDLAPNGYYKYSFNRWLRLKNFVLDGHGATLQNISKDVYAYPRAPIYVGGHGKDYFSNTYSSPPNYGYQINTANPGDTTVTLQSSANNVNFYVGGAVVVYSYETQFGGYPPDDHFYDIGRVKNIKGAVITLDTPIRYFHSSNWPEVPSVGTNMSKARIAPVDRKDGRGNILNELAHYCHIKNVVMADNPNLTSSAQYFGGELTENFIVENCTLNQFAPSQVKNFIARNCTFTHSTDLDKFMDTGLIEETDMQGFVGGGPKNLTIRNSRIHGLIKTHADALTLEGNMFDYSTQAGTFMQEIDLANNKDAIIRGNHFFGKNGSSDSSIISYAGSTNPIQIAGSVSIANNYTVTLPLGSYPNQQFLGKIQVGSLVWGGPMVNSQYSNNNNYGVVQAIRDSGDGGVTCQVDILFQQTVNANDYVVPVKPVSADIWGNTYVGNSQPLFQLGPALGRQENSLVDGKYHLQFKQDINSSLPIWGRINKIVIDVVTPYTGTGQSTALFFISDFVPHYHSILQVVNLKTAGRREINLTATVNGQTGDTLSALPLTNFVNAMSFFNGNTAGGGHVSFTGPNSQMAVVNVTIETDTEMFKQF